MKVRPIDDVIKDCNKIMISKLPGDETVKATWAALCLASQHIGESESVFADPEDAEPAWERMYRRWYHGQRYAAATIVRKIADALGVPNEI